MRKVTIVIVHYGPVVTTIDCLQSIKKASVSERTIVANNGSKRDSTKIKKIFPKISIIENNGNIGFAKAVNRVIKLALLQKPEYILLLNNDTIAGQNFLSELLKTSLFKKADIVGGKIFTESGAVWFEGGEIDKVRFTAGHTKGKTDFVSGCCMLVKSQLFSTVGFFDERYYLYYEDVDFCVRALKVGAGIAVSQKSHIIHNVNRSRLSTKRMRYYLFRNHFYFVAKHAPFWVKIRELIRFPYTLLEYFVTNN